MKVGYARVSTSEQNEARQVEAFKGLGIEKIFLDKMSGKNTARPELQEMLKFVREGDTVYITEYSRLARSTVDLLNLVQRLTDKGVNVVSIKESLDTSTPNGKFMLTVFAGLSELERATIRQRQKEGIAIAKAQGKFKGKQPIKIDVARFKKECEKWRNNEQTAVATMKKFGLKKNTFYRKVKELGL